MVLVFLALVSGETILTNWDSSQVIVHSMSMLHFIDSF